MKQTTKYNFKKRIANTFGSLGYLFGFLQWFWGVMLYLSVIQSLISFISSDNGKPIEQPAGFNVTLPEPIGVVILAAVVIMSLVLTVYAIISVPRSIVKTSNKIVYKTVETMVPVVIKAQHKQDTKKNRIKITAKLMVAIKLLLIILPLIVTAASRFLEEQSIDYSIALIVGGGLACFSIVLFAVQYLLAGTLRVKISDLW